MSRNDRGPRNKRGGGGGGGAGKHRGHNGNPPSHRAWMNDEEQGFGGSSRLGMGVKSQWDKYDSTAQMATSPVQPSTKSKTQGKKTKFINIYDTAVHDRTVIKLPGRHECDCQATAHALVNNCIKCGRIICEQEGSGPCFSCSALVCTQEEQKIFDEGGKKSNELRTKLLLLPLPKPASAKNEQERQATVDKWKGQVKSDSAPVSEDSLKKAIAEKDRLLDYQQNSARRTTVLDYQSDYFDTNANQWLTPEQRQKLRQRQEELNAMRNVPRSQRKITLDFAGRQVLEDTTTVDMYNPNDTVLQEIYNGKSGAVASNINDYQNGGDVDFEAYKPIYMEGEINGTISTKDPSSSKNTKSGNRLQDGILKDVVDEGKCLSMHQPYASLLVRGIKKHEGRSWYTSHRGPLWIASAQKPTTDDEISEVEGFYQQYYNGSVPGVFPNLYPTSCLLGCVEVVDCLTQERYRELYPNGESESAYVWICQNPRELTVHIPIRGQHKIYKLDPSIHMAAKKMLR